MRGSSKVDNGAAQTLRHMCMTTVTPRGHLDWAKVGQLGFGPMKPWLSDWLITQSSYLQTKGEWEM